MVVQLFGTSCSSVFSITLIQCADSGEYTAAVHVPRMKDQIKGSVTPSCSKGMQEQILDAE